MRSLRRQAGLTLEELAFRAKINPSYLGEVERGKRNPSFRNLEKIAAGLGVSISAFFSSSGEKIKQSGARKDNDVYTALKQLAAEFKDTSKKDLEYVIKMAKSLARKLKK